METNKPEQPQMPAEDPIGVALRIEKLVTGGDGLARSDEGTCFVPRTAPGDLVRAAIVEKKRGFQRAEMLELLEPGPGRQTPPCLHFAECGGCDLQHLTQEVQLAAKTGIVTDCFQRLGKLDVSALIATTSSGDGFGWRGILRLHAHPTGFYGLRRRGSHEVVRLETCPIMAAPFAETILPWLRFLPPVDQVKIRLDGRGGWLLSMFGQPSRLRILKKIISALEPGTPPAPGLQGMLFNNRPMWGRDHLVHHVAGHKYRVGAESFFQGNAAVAGMVVAMARSWIEEIAAEGRLGPRLADLYCGVGLFTLALADRFEAVAAVEMDAGACRDAENNIARDSDARGKAVVHQGDLVEVLGRNDVMPEDLWPSALCLVDPPRTGLGKDGTAALLARRPRHIMYMSCDPSTQARDAAAFAAAGYALRRLQVFDMFPQSAHIETLLLLEDPVS